MSVHVTMHKRLGGLASQRDRTVTEACYARDFESVRRHDINGELHSPINIIRIYTVNKYISILGIGLEFE